MLLLTPPFSQGRAARETPKVIPLLRVSIWGEAARCGGGVGVLVAKLSFTTDAGTIACHVHCELAAQGGVLARRATGQSAVESSCAGLCALNACEASREGAPAADELQWRCTFALVLYGRPCC